MTSEPWSGGLAGATRVTIARRVASGPRPAWHGIAKGGLEAIDAAIAWVMHTALGFRKPEHCKTAITVHREEPKLYPHPRRGVGGWGRRLPGAGRCGRGLPRGARAP